MAKDRTPILVSEEILKSLSHRPSDRRWAIEKVDSELQKIKVDWINYQSVINRLNRSRQAWAEDRFKENYPDFPNLVHQHTVAAIKGFPLGWVLAPLLTVVYGAALLTSPSFLLSSDFGVFIFAVVSIGWPWVLGFIVLTFFVAANVRIGGFPALVPSELLDKRTKVINSLVASIETQISEQVMSRFFLSTSKNPQDLISSVEGRWIPQGPRPINPDRELSPKEAEEFVAAQLRFHGATGVAVTRFSKDGGVDIVSDLFVSQVKHQVANVGVKTIRELRGVTSSDHSALVFAKSGFSKEAIEFANLHNVGLFTYLPHLVGANRLAEGYLSKGFSKRLAIEKPNQ